MHHAGVHQRIGSNNYWCAGSDENCEGTFGWCDIDRPLAKWLPWCKGEPDNTGGHENCVVFNHNTGLMSTDVRSLLSDTSCDAKVQFICEVIL
jgi:hypothetical protein